MLNEHLVHVVNTSYKVKPLGNEIAGLSRRFNETKAKLVDIKSLLQGFLNGYSYVLARFNNERKAVNFVQSSLVMLDIENNDKEREQAKERGLNVPERKGIYTKMQLNDVLSVLEELKCVAAFETMSSKENNYRIRALFQFEKPITDNKEYKMLVTELIEKVQSKLTFVEVDRACSDSIRIFLQGKKGGFYKLFNYKNTLDVEPLLRTAALKAQKVEKERAERKQVHHDIDFETLKEMAEVVGYIPNYKDWITAGLALKEAYESGVITYDEGLELFIMLSDSPDEAQSKWNSFKVSTITIGSFIRMSKEKGFKATFKHYTKPCTTKEAVFRYQKYISEQKELLNAILKGNEVVLVNSPTGSGKTFAFVDSMKSFKDEDIYIFVTPTRALTDQVAFAYDVTKVKGKEGEERAVLRTKVENALCNDSKVFVSTYDKCFELFDLIKSMVPGAKIRIVVDEFHKTVRDYHYRAEAIRNIYKVKEKADTFIGLSGTPQEIEKSEFTKIVKFEPVKKEQLFQTIGIYEHNSKEDYKESLIPLVVKKVKEAHKQLLVFLENKNEIDIVADTLKPFGITTVKVTSDSRKEEAYEEIQKGNMPAADVILSTSVIADGVSITNNKLDTEIIVCINHKSNNRHVVSLKQMSHRLRKPYRAFTILLNTNVIDEEEERISSDFNVWGYIEKGYRNASRLKEKLENKYFQNLLIDDVYLGKIERGYAIRKDTDENGLKYLYVDRNEIRRKAFKIKNTLDTKEIDAFKTSLQTIFECQNIQVLDVKEEISKHATKEHEETQRIIAELKALEDEAEEAKEAAFEQIFTKELYEGYLLGDKEAHQAIKSGITKKQQKAITKLSGLLSYEALKVVATEKKHDTFLREVKMLEEVLVYKGLGVRNETTTVIALLYRALNGKEMTWEEVNITVNEMAKETKHKGVFIKKLLDAFSRQERKVTQGEKRVRIFKFGELITIETLAEKFGIQQDDIRMFLINSIERLERENKAEKHQIELLKHL